MEYSLGAMNLAATHLEPMVAFYGGVFGIEFTEEPVGDDVLYAGQLAGTPFVLLPAALAQVDAKQNRMQLDVHVDDLDASIARVEQHGGRTNGHIGEDDEARCIGVFDPDDNFMVFKQLK